MAYEYIIFERVGNVAVIKFNRPNALNAVSPEVFRDFSAALDQVEQDPGVRVVVLTGEGEKAFVAGADIKYMADLSPLEGRRWAETGHNIMFRLENLPMPLIACVNGFALGAGTEIAMACDFIYASEKAKFGQPEVNLGLLPGFGGTQRLSRRVGKGMAKELCMTGAMIGAQEAKELGLVNKVFPPDKLWEETMKIANLIATKGRISLRAMKQCIDRGLETDLRTGCHLEVETFGLNFSCPDAKEGMSAFMEKRPAVFKS